ncbi:MAG TPA: hypothetical protein DIT04_07020 [Dysgonomonas sp.]|nr:hypothetical protein [Dysgonomonas sp.]
MAALKITCFLDETQMTSLTDFISRQLFGCTKDEIEDIDTCFDTMNIRLCVEYSIGLETIELRQAEILDSDWNLIDADSAVLRSRLRRMIENYNYTQKQSAAYC